MDQHTIKMPIYHDQGKYTIHGTLMGYHDVYYIISELYQVWLERNHARYDGVTPNTIKIERQISKSLKFYMNEFEL